MAELNGPAYPAALNSPASLPLAGQDWANTKPAHRFFSDDRVGEEPRCGAEEPDHQESE